MKKLFIIPFVLLFVVNITFAAPNYNGDYKGVTYDTTYNNFLYNYLNEKFYKKYPDIVEKDKEGNLIYHVTYSNEARYKEVSQIYTWVMKNLNEVNLSNDMNKSKDELLKEILEDIAYYNELQANYDNTCGVANELYFKKVKEEKQKYQFFNEHKLYKEMLSNGTLCSPTAPVDMIYTPFHQKRMMKLKSNLNK